SDQDIRHRITFSGGWGLPYDRVWRFRPQPLSQGVRVFPIVPWHTGYPFDIFARLGDRFNPGSEGPSGAGDPTNVHANIAGATNTFKPSNPQTINGTTANFFFNPISFTTAQCGDSNNPIATCVPSATIFPSNAQVVANP